MLLLLLVSFTAFSANAKYVVPGDVARFGFAFNAFKSTKARLILTTAPTEGTIVGLVSVNV